MSVLWMLALTLAMPAHGVVGGSPAPNKPQVAALLGFDSATRSGLVVCTVTLISKRAVLTAAHCVDAVNAAPPTTTWYISFTDSPYKDGWGDTVRISRMIKHPQWDPKPWVNDVAIIQLASARSGPTVWLNDVPRDWAGASVSYFGYGETVTDRSDEGVRRHTALGVSHCTTGPNDPAVPCEQQDGTFFLSQSGPANLCTGDSGGPAFHAIDGQEVQIGVNSWVQPRAACEGGVTGTLRVSRYAGWIRDNTRGVKWVSARK